jgi:hypothetical protein
LEGKEQMKIKFGEAEMEILYPQGNLENTFADTNTKSIVAKLVFGKNSFLFAGDLPGEREVEILGKDIKADILKVAHHGSKNSTGDDFLEKIAPRDAIISVGKNSYGHPTPEVLEKLKGVAENVKKYQIESKRVNEVGNKIELIIKSELIKIGFSAKTPNSKSTGYPDIEFVDSKNRLHYLECKTYNIKNIDTTQRSFYLSPSEDFKVKQDGIHFGLSFEVEAIENKKYKINSWKILDFSELKLDVKYEFNSNNRKMYKKELILAESI